MRAPGVDQACAIGHMLFGYAALRAKMLGRERAFFRYAAAMIARLPHAASCRHHAHRACRGTASARGRGALRPAAAADSQAELG
ncbi:MAG TPA: hypothetical protein DDZ67_04055 [Xanthomonadaceae bacterium]|nr:hypothetical protein [Xanthomonadaceae bacterium]